MWQKNQNSLKEQLLLSYTQLLNDGSTKIPISLSSSDLLNVVQQKEEALKQATANLQAVFNHTQISFVLLDVAFNIVSFNQIARKSAGVVFGMSLEKGKNFITLIRQEQQKEAEEMMQQVLIGNRFEFETDYPHSNGVFACYQIKMNPVYDSDNHIIGLCIATTDITTKKIDELERIKMTNDLMQRNKNLEEFAYIVSHHLRAPVANLLGIAQIFQTIPISQQERNTFEHCLYQAVEQLDVTVKDLNQILQAKQNDIEKKVPVRFETLVDDVQTNLLHLIQKEKVQIKTNFSALAQIHTSESYLYSIFYNLILNSIKFAQSNLDPVIEIESLQVGKTIQLIFKDNGMGLDLDKIGDQLFGLYKRFHPYIEGKGVGLFMVKTYVDSLQGSIQVKSKPGKGTAFYIQFQALS